MNFFLGIDISGEFFSTRLFSIGNTPITIEKIILFVIVLGLTVVVSRLFQRAMVHALKLRKVTDEGTVGVFKRLLHYIVLAVGIGIALEIIGINLGALFAAGAIFAIGIGFAMQNIVQNFVSGVILLVERSIKPGDVLQVENRLVRVREMGIRATVVRTLDEEELIVPNSVIVQSTVTNYTLQNSLYRLRATVGVTYSSDMALVKQTLTEVAEALPGRVASKPPVVFMTEFADSSVNFEVSVWIDDPWLMRRARSELNEAIWWALKNAGIVIAFPQRDIHLDPEVSASLARLGARD
jgi:small-conductance mechanosensitive channel